MDKYRKQLEGILARATEVNDELDTLADLDELTEDQETRHAELMTEGAALAVEEPEVRSQVEAHDAIRALRGREGVEVVEGTRTAPAQINRTDDPYNIDEVRINVGQTGSTELRGRALKAVEGESRYSLDDAGKERLTYLLERKDDRTGTIAKLVLATGSEVYRQAFAKAISGATHMLSGEEQAALARAASLTDAAGGFAVPFPIDPTLVLTNSGSANPFRQISRVESITSDSWQGVSAGAVSASWDGEAAEASDDTPTYAQPQVVAKKAQAFVPYSIEIGQDYNGFAADIAMAILEGKDELEGAAFATGAAGGNTPVGIVTALVAGAVNVPTSAVADTYGLADVYATMEALPAKYRSKPGTAWAMNLSIINDTRQFGTTDDAFMTDLTAGSPPQLLGKRLVESSDMDGAVGAAVENYVAIVGDWSNYLIADRVGLSLENVPHMFATANNLPSGQRGIYAHWRVGADSINDNAFALLNVT